MTAELHLCREASEREKVELEAAKRRSKSITTEFGAIATHHLGLPTGIYQNLLLSCRDTLPVGITEVVISL